MPLGSNSLRRRSSSSSSSNSSRTAAHNRSGGTPSLGTSRIKNVARDDSRDAGPRKVSRDSRHLEPKVQTQAKAAVVVASAGDA
jgi:hypothetical protein